MSRAFLAATALVFIGFGLWGFASPDGMAQRLGLQVTGPDGRTFLRALYGGNLVGVGLLFAWCAARGARVRFGLRAVILCTGPILAARILAMVVDGAVGPYHLSYAGLELAGVAGAAMLLRRETRRAAAAGA